MNVHLSKSYHKVLKCYKLACKYLRILVATVYCTSYSNYMFYGSINKTTNKFSSLTPKNTCTYGCYGNMLFLFSLSLSLSLSIYIYMSMLCCIHIMYLHVINWTHPNCAQRGLYGCVSARTANCVVQITCKIKWIKSQIYTCILYTRALELFELEWLLELRWNYDAIKWMRIELHVQFQSNSMGKDPPCAYMYMCMLLITY